MKSRFRALSHHLAMSVGVVFFTSTVLASEKPDPAGTWLWHFKRPGRQDRDSPPGGLTLKREGDKLTGTFRWRDGVEGPIKEAMFSDGELSFVVTREGSGGQEYTYKLRGRLSGDEIYGTVTLGVSKAVYLWRATRETEANSKRPKQDQTLPKPPKG